MNKLMSFLRAPLNQTAVVTLVGMGWAVFQGSVSWQHALPVFGGAIVALILPDNSVAKADVEQAIQDAVQAFQDVKGGGAGQPAVQQQPPAA